jgi:DNA replication protein DnaC
MMQEQEAMESEAKRLREYRVRRKYGASTEGSTEGSTVTPSVPPAYTPRSKKQEARSKPPVVPHGDVFEQLWTEYPRKVGKAAAQKAWVKLMAGGQGYDPKTIWNGLTRWVEHWESKGTSLDYVPHMATWLNQRRFLEAAQ